MDLMLPHFRGRSVVIFSIGSKYSKFDIDLRAFFTGICCSQMLYGYVRHAWVGFVCKGIVFQQVIGMQMVKFMFFLLLAKRVDLTSLGLALA